jgi:hypothetical protein
MDIFVGNLPQKTQVDEIRRLFETVLRPRGLSAVLPKSRKQPRRGFNPPRYQIVELSGDRPMRYGHVVLFPDSMARQAIKDLQDATLRGEQIVVREFVRRAYINDRRSLHWRSQPWQNEERRYSERRRGAAMNAASF